MTHQARGESPAESECDRTRRLVQEFLDGELEETVVSAIRVHVDGCPGCGRRVHFESAFLRTVSRSSKTGQLPADVERRFNALLAEWKKANS
jgi:anti-sigma factor (TIGR02949 family)